MGNNPCCFRTVNIISKGGNRGNGGPLSPYNRNVRVCYAGEVYNQTWICSQNGSITLYTELMGNSIGREVLDCSEPQTETDMRDIPCVVDDVPSTLVSPTAALSKTRQLRVSSAFGVTESSSVAVSEARESDRSRVGSGTSSLAAGSGVKNN